MRWRLAGGLLALTGVGLGLALTMGGLPVRKSGAPVAASQSVFELVPADVVQAQIMELSQGLAISGTLRAEDFAVVRVRVAGELQGLTVREGDAVKAGQVLARIDPTEYQARLSQAREQADAARAQVEMAQRQSDNNKALVDQGFISKTALESSQSSLMAAQATHKAALAGVDVARKTLDDTQLRAPMAGVVSQRLAQSGERLGVDARVLEIVEPRRLELEASVSAADSVQVRAGQQAQVRVEGLPTPVAARVVRINPSAQSGSRSVMVYLSVASHPGLRQGLFAQAVLATGRISGLTVPLQAVRTDKPAPYVQVIENQRVVHKPVGVGERGSAGGQSLVTVTGLEAGALVIQGHVGVLREGSAVQVGALPASKP